MKNVKILLFMIICMVAITCFSDDVYAVPADFNQTSIEGGGGNSSNTVKVTKCVYDYITFTITPDGNGSATLSDPEINKTSYEVKNNYVTVSNFIKSNKITCPNSLFYSTESGGYGAANSGKTYIKFSFINSDIPASTRGSIELTDSTNNNNDISIGGSENENAEYTCSYTGQINGNKLVIVKHSSEWEITYPNGNSKTLPTNSVGSNSLPSSNCEDVFYSKEENVVKMVKANSSYTNIYVSQYCSQYDDLEQFCDDNSCKITKVSCGSESETNEYGSCPQEIAPLILFIKKVVFNTLKIFVPIILIIMATIDLVKAVMASDEKTMTEAIPKIIRRVLTAVLMFFVTLIVTIVIDMFAKTDVGEQGNWTNCWQELD